MSPVDKLSFEPDQIIEYLAKHPDFFNKNTDVLRNLMIPHQVNKNVYSLTGHRLTFLKNQNREITREREDLVNLLEYERKLTETVHKVIIKLRSSNSLDQLHKILSKW